MFALAIMMLFLSCVSASSGSYDLRFVYYDYVEKNVYLFFTDTSKKSISNCEMNATKTLSLSDAQVYLASATNENSTYYISLTFSPMLRTDTNKDTTERYYKVTVWSAGDNPSELGTVDVQNSSGRTVKFTGNTVSDTSTSSDFYYPISFQFSDYLTTYSDGSYSATITAEVTAQ